MTYTELRDELASIICPHPSVSAWSTWPCEVCLDAAYRVVVHRQSICRALTRFSDH